MILIFASIVIFLGLGFAASPTMPFRQRHGETLVSLIARHTFLSPGLFGEGLGHILYFLTLGSVLLVLLIASNAAYAGLPRLLAFMARDGYAPRVLLSLGDRLVHNRSIIYLSIISGLLLWALDAQVSSLIGLYAVACLSASRFRKRAYSSVSSSPREAGLAGRSIAQRLRRTGNRRGRADHRLQEVQPGRLGRRPRLIAEL